MKKNWIYIVLLCFIVLLNVLPRFTEKPDTKRTHLVETLQVEEEKSETMFVSFDEAKMRTERIERMLKENLPLYLFYISLNLLVIFIFFSGLVADGYFIFSKFRKKNIFQKTYDLDPPLWEIVDIFKITILAVAASYVFFMAFGFIIGILEGIMDTKFSFYKNENFRMIFDTIVLDFAILLVILSFLHRIYKKKIADIGLVKENFTKNIFYGILGYVGVIPVIFIIGILVYVVLNILKLKPPPQPIVGLFLAEKNIILIFVSSMIASIFGPLIEEIFFRGVMYNAVKQRVGIFWAILITSLLFSFLHTHAMSYFLVGFIPITILGAVLAYLYEKTGSLVPSMTLHILNNMGSVFMVFLFKYFNNLVQ